MLELNQIHHGDCLELMKLIPTGSIDMILCDLPYGTTACEWDSIIDMGKLWQEYERVIKDNGAIVLTANASFTFKLWQSNEKLFRYRWIWRKNTHTGFLLAKKQPLRNFEDVLVFYKALPIYNPQKTRHTGRRSSMKAGNKNNRDVYGISKRSSYEDDGTRYPTDILEFSNVMQGSIHPTQKPVALFEYLIKTYTNEGDLVLDNCSGSGTTAIACLNSNRQFICIEQNEEYIKRSRQRVLDHEPLLNLKLDP
jgi:site-specific DNA-methyltransferase (adenine-specific)